MIFFVPPSAIPGEGQILEFESNIFYPLQPSEIRTEHALQVLKIMSFWIVKFAGRQPNCTFRTKNPQFLTLGQFEEVFAINSQQDKEKAQTILCVLSSILTQYCVEFISKTVLRSSPRRLAIGVLSEPASKSVFQASFGLSSLKGTKPYCVLRTKTYPKIQDFQVEEF